MALKGSATIELTNADGSKEIIKHDNMITNAVNDLCLSQRGEQAAILKMVNQNESYAQAMFGGLLLFGDTLNDNPDDYELPSAKIIGYASQSAYAGLDLARGSFNQSEGGVQEDGSYKFVWDFSTSQANGTIKSLALCPNVMGQIGASDTIVDSERSNFQFVREPQTPFNSYGRMLSDSETVDGAGTWCYHIAAIIGDIAYAVNYYNIYNNDVNKARCIVNNGGILKLYRFKLGTEAISLADKVAMARYIDCIDIAIPTELLSVLSTSYDRYTISLYFNQRDNKLIVFPCSTKSNVAVNGTIPYIDIDLVNNMNITKYTFTNTTAGTIYLTQTNSYVSDYDASYRFWVIEDYILVISGDGDARKLYIIDRTDNTKINAAQGELATNNSYFLPLFAEKNVMVVGLRSESNTGNINDVYIISLKTGEARRTNVSGYMPIISAKGNVSFGNKAIKVRTGTYLTYYVTINPFILTTKNNLDSPVLKTASQTMKITYTLSEVAESGV